VIYDTEIRRITDATPLPTKNIATYIQTYDEALDDKDFNDSKFSYRVLFIRKTANRKGQADKVIEYVDPKSDMAKGLSKEYWAFKDREKKKYLPSSLCKDIQEIGYSKFTITSHTKLWQAEDAKNLSKGYGVQLEKTWYWYESWFDFVKKHCEENKYKYS